MGEELILQLGHDALKITAMVAAPVLLSALVMGLLVSVFQALTQINEATLTFIPKLIIVAIVLVIAGPWMLDLMKTYTTELFTNITVYVRE